MNECYLGVDIGSISTKGVIIDSNNKIIASSYLYTEGSPINAVKKLIHELKSQINLNKYMVVSVGTTGSARKLIGTILDASVVKNEITAHAVGTTSIYPNVRTIFEIGGQDSKIIILDNKIVIDYAMNTLCASGTGSFLSSQAKRLVAGLCKSIVLNYLNNVGKGKKIKPPIVFQGGVSKNIGVVKAFENACGEDIIVDPNSHLMGALGVAILAKKSNIKKKFSFDIEDINFETKGINCRGCSNNCEIICVSKDKKVIDAWGNRCEKGEVKIHN